MSAVLRPRELLWAAMAAYAVGFSTLSVLRHRSFETGRFDLGNMVQAVWSTAHGDPLAVTNLRGEQTVRLAAHVDPIIAVFAPLWWVWPSPDMLLVAQAFAIGSGALPVFWLARKHLGSERAALGFALSYLLYPATQWLTLNEFHPVALACPLLLYAFWYLDEDRLAVFALFAAAAMLTKEEVPLVVAGIGLWYWLARGRRRFGVAVAAVGVLGAALAIGVIVPHFNEGAQSAFYGRYEEVGGSAGGIARTAATEPQTLIRVALDERGLRYLVALLVPLLALPLAAPLALVAAVPELAINLLSATRTQTSIHFHYTAAEIPVLFFAAVLGAAWLARRRPGSAMPLATAVGAAVLVSNYVLGPIPVWRHFPGGEKLQARGHEISEHDRIARRALRLIPPGDVVSASNSLGAHLSARRRILSFPYVFDARWIAVDETRPGYADRLDPAAHARRVSQIRRNTSWRLVFSEDGVLIFRRQN